MNKQELSAMVAQLLRSMELPEPPVKASDYKPSQPLPEEGGEQADSGQVEDITQIDLRKQYLVEGAADPEAFCRLKAHTPARLGCGRAGPRYLTRTVLRFRADHAAAQDAVFSQVPEGFAKENDLIETQTKCRDKEMYLTRPDLGRCLDEESQSRLRAAIPGKPRVQLVVGDGLSSAAILANGMDCLMAIRDGLTLRGIETGPGVFVRYCRVGAGDSIGDVLGCELVCLLVGERPGLVTDRSMSVYLTYAPHTGSSEASRTVVSNIHAQGTPAVEAGAYVAELIETILRRKVSGVALKLEAAE